MYVKKLKRKCGVRGCKNTESFAISRTREMGNSVIICKSCLGKALGAIDEVNPETNSNIPVISRPAPPLFFNAEAQGSARKEETTNSAEDSSAEKFVCEYCGREFKAKIGLISHLKACTKKEGVSSEE